MAAKSPPRPRANDDRDARLKQALKANLARRKAQAKARGDADNKQVKATEQDDG